MGGKEVLDGEVAKKTHLEIRQNIVQMSQIVGSEDTYAFGEVFRLYSLAFKDFVAAVFPDLAEPEKKAPSE